jgi:hypothetical protein
LVFLRRKNTSTISVCANRYLPKIPIPSDGKQNCTLNFFLYSFGPVKYIARHSFLNSNEYLRPFAFFLHLRYLGIYKICQFLCWTKLICQRHILFKRNVVNRSCFYRVLLPMSGSSFTFDKFRFLIVSQFDVTDLFGVFCLTSLKPFVCCLEITTAKEVLLALHQVQLLKKFLAKFGQDSNFWVGLTIFCRNNIQNSNSLLNTLLL